MALIPPGCVRQGARCQNLVPGFALQDMPSPKISPMLAVSGLPAEALAGIVAATNQKLKLPEAGALKLALINGPTAWCPHTLCPHSVPPHSLPHFSFRPLCTLARC